MASSESPTWEVTGQIPDVGQNAQGVFVQGTTVSYRTKSGGQGKVFVPQSDFTVDKVRDLVSSAAAHAEAVANLKG